MSKKPDLEKTLVELEQVVKKLESGDLVLDDSLKLFESGVHLYKDCKKAISEAEKKIKILTDKLEEEDF